MPISKEILERYPNVVFIETGTNHGDGVQAALDADCFNQIYSVELSLFGFGWCSHRFWDLREKVWLFQGDSREFLAKTLPDITSRSTFWLDAHFCDGDAGDPNDVPLMGELKRIYDHPIKEHTILIDDIRLMGSPSLNVSLSRVTRCLRMINPDYIIERINSPEFENDILVARP